MPLCEGNVQSITPFPSENNAESNAVLQDAISCSFIFI